MPTVPTLRRRRERLLCLHCSGSSGRQWAPFAEALSSRFEVVAPELLGYGEPAAWPDDPRALLDAEVDALARWLDDDAELHLLGHSYGGAVALQVALRRPARVSSLTVYEPVRFALLFGEVGDAAAARDIVAAGRGIAALARAGEREAAAERFVDYWSGPGAWRAIAAPRRATLAARMPKVAAEFEGLFADAVPASAYASLTMPVRLLGGTRSPAPATAVLERLAIAMPRAARVALEQLGHMGPIEDPLRVLAALPIGLPQARAA